MQQYHFTIQSRCIYLISSNNVFAPVADTEICNIRRCECQIFRKLISCKQMTIDQKINRIGNTCCKEGPVIALHSVILPVTLRK